MPRKNIITQGPFLFDSDTGRICGVRHPDGTEEFIVLSNVRTGTPVNGVRAAITSDMTNANADITLTAVDYGAGGNNISMTYINPGAINQSLKVLVNGKDILVYLATNGAGAITSTAILCAAAINAHQDALKLVAATYEGTGLGVVNAKVKALLAGGVTCTPGIAGSSMMKDSTGFLWLKTGDQTWSSFTTTIVDATTTVKGKVELATDAETQTGTDTQRAITPSNLSARTATETRTGLAELATKDEAIAGVDTGRITTPAGNAASEAIIKNPLAFAQGVNLTAGSGSTGIAVADDDDIDFGTGNFTLVWKGSLPDWTPVTYPPLIEKYQDDANRWIFGVYAGTGLYFHYYKTGSATLTVNPAITLPTDGTVGMVCAVITRETAAVAGSVEFYVNGLLKATSVLFAGAPPDISNIGSVYISGTNAVRNASTTHFAATFNRALSAAEVLDLYRNGINAADKWGSQVSIITGNDSTFAGASNWANVDINAYDETGDLTITANAIGQYCTLPVANAPMVAGKKYRLVFDVANLVSTWTIKDFGGTQTIGTINAAGTGQSIEFTASTSGGLRIVSNAADSSADIDNVYLYQIGVTLALEPEGIQPSPGQWLDSSSNKLHAMQPAAGSSLVRLKNEFEFRWTNVWTASSAAQYIGGLNQVILTAKHFITSIVSRATVITDVENVTIGDGSDVDYYVTAIAPTAAPIIHTLAKNLNDGTNLKLVVTPAAEATMTIEFIVKGYLLE